MNSGNWSARWALNAFLVIAIAVITSSCSFPGLSGSIRPDSSDSTPDNIAWIFADPNAAPTSTPFRPGIPTPTYIPAEHPTAEPTDILPTQRAKDKNKVDPLAVPEGTINILLLGSDQRPYGHGFRTDTIVLLSLNPKAGTASMTSFPRDLYVYIPTYGYQRINTAMVFRGFEGLQNTFEYNFGIKPSNYVMINFWVFEELIDDLGGIDVYAAKPMTGYRTAYGSYTVPAGLNHMDGTTALWYARWRKTSNDFDRTRRQQEILQGVYRKLLSMNAVNQAKDLYQLYKENVFTDISFSQIIPLLPLVFQIKEPSDIQTYLIGSKHVTPWITPAGAQVLIPDKSAIQTVIRKALNIPENE